MTKAKKYLALLLAVLMCVSLVPTVAFAEAEPEEYTVVCIGDSTSQGYFVTDYVDKEQGAYDNSSKDAYPNKLAQYIQSKFDEKGENVQVKLRNMTFQGLRTDELRAILDPDFVTEIADKKNGGYGDTFLDDHYYDYNNYFENGGKGRKPHELTRERFAEDGTDVSGCTYFYDLLKAKGYVDYTIEPGDVSYVDRPAYEKNKENGNIVPYIESLATIKGVPAATVAFEESIKKADVITLDITMNNFGTYLSQRFMDLVNMPDGGIYGELASEVGPGLDIDIAAVEKTVSDLLDQYLPEDLGLPQELVKGLLDTFVYCYCDFRVNFAEDIRLIRELNKDAQVIVLGTYNTMANMKCKIGDINLDFGALWGAYSALVNTYITTTCKYKDQYCFADCATGGVQTFIEGLAKGEPSDIYLNALIYDSDKCGQLFGGAYLMTEGAKAGMAPDVFAMSAMDMITAMLNKAGIEAQAGENAALVPGYSDAVAFIDDPDNAWMIPIARAFMMFNLDESAVDGAANYAIQRDLGDQMLKERFMEAAALDPIGFTEVFDALAGGDMTALFGNAVALEEPGLAEMSMLHIFLRFLSARGMGAHPDFKGCQQKTDYVIAAYEANQTADKSAGDAIKDMGKNIFSAAWTTLRAPVLDAIKGVFDNFANAMQEFLNFLFKPLTDIIDLLPFC